MTCDLRRATHRYTALTRRFCTYVYVDFLPIQIHRVVHLLYVHCAGGGCEGVAERRTGRSKGVKRTAKYIRDRGGE